MTKVSNRHGTTPSTPSPSPSPSPAPAPVRHHRSKHIIQHHGGAAGAGRHRSTLDRSNAHTTPRSRTFDHSLLTPTTPALHSKQFQQLQPPYLHPPQSQPFTTSTSRFQKPTIPMVQLRYASDSKESDWLVRQSSTRSSFFISKTNSTPKRLFFKLRGSTLSAHPDTSYPELWRATVKELRHIDQPSLTFDIKVDKVILQLKADSRDVFNRWAAALNRSAGAEFERFYKKEKLIGKGHFSSVYLAVDKVTNDQFAVKVIKKDKNDMEKSKKFIRREVKVLSITDHPNLIKAIDFFSSNNKPHIVLEYIKGGSLKDLIKKQKRVPEKLAKAIMKGILQGVAYLHYANIVHRDLKPENILMVTQNTPKITDFGLATFRNEDKHIHSVVGTPSYVAPEVIRNIPYGPAADVWSCGIILYYMVTGERPFTGENREEIKRCILKGDLSFPSQLFGTCSPETKHLINSMLNYDPQSRVTADEALKHPWISRDSNQTIDIDME